MKNLAIIPARGGSKRIPGKNIRDFCGRPILSYSIQAARECGIFEEVMVSTDDDRIAEIGRQFGAVVPFMRSAATADDRTPLAEAILEVLLAYEARGKNFDNICCILATAPFLTHEDIKKAYSEFLAGGYDSVFPVVRFGYPIFRALRFEGGKVSMFWPENRDSRSQDFELAFHDAGAFYWAKVDALKSECTLFMANSGGLVVSEALAQDIDTEEDWRIAEIKYRIQEVK